MMGKAFGIWMAFIALVTFWSIYEPPHDGDWYVCTDGEQYTVCYGNHSSDMFVTGFRFIAQNRANSLNRHDAEDIAHSEKSWRAE